MKKIAVITAFMLCIVLIPPFNSFAEDEKNLSSYVLMEAETHYVADEYNSDKRLNCGYLSKLMTLLLIAEDIDSGKYSLNDTITASASVNGTKGAVIWLQKGDCISVEELLKSIIIGNANDAVTVLAEHSETTVENFVMRMNAESFDLGLRNTAFCTPYGYYDEREYSSAYDMAVICCELSKYEFLRPYFKTRHDFVKSGLAELVSENPLITKYGRHIGFKVCHSENSGNCIAEGGRDENGTVYIAVVFGADDMDTATETAVGLLKDGFRNFRKISTMFPDEMLHPVKVIKGMSSASEIIIENQSELIVPYGSAEISTVVVIPEYITAPVKKGQRIGTAVFYNGDKAVYESPIITADSVRRISINQTVIKMMLNMLQ